MRASHRAAACCLSAWHDFGGSVLGVTFHRLHLRGIHRNRALQHLTPAPLLGSHGERQPGSQHIPKQLAVRAVLF